MKAEQVRLSTLVEPTQPQLNRLASVADTVSELEREQTELTARLSQFPRYRVIAPSQVGIDQLQASLRPGEAYLKMMAVSGALYMLFISPDDAIAYRPEVSEAELEFEVQSLRDTIVLTEGDERLVYPFDVARSRSLYEKLLEPIHDRLQAAQHLVFEPDAAMLQLPASILVTDDEGVEAYLKRVADGGDEYDFTGVAWLGRNLEISTAVSPRGFMQIREIAPSQAQRDYLGLGENEVPASEIVRAATTDPCAWPVETWSNPIASDELYFAAERLGNSQVLVGSEFTDTALLANEDLDDYRILHFATHGLVTAPRPSCPSRPALVTSFGGEGSDGLLNFREVFDLNLDADVVILSACDTAGMATISASREAGVTTGGNFALDGLVRAFTAAGARSVIASHWPTPDDFDATKRLIEGMIDAPSGTVLARSLLDGQRQLMDEAATSHPFYWAAFIILGDGQKELVGSMNAGG